MDINHHDIVIIFVMGTFFQQKVDRSGMAFSQTHTPVVSSLASL